MDKPTNDSPSHVALYWFLRYMEATGGQLPETYKDIDTAMGVKRGTVSRIVKDRPSWLEVIARQFRIRPSA